MNLILKCYINKHTTLHNILPCGKVLKNWLPHISDKCKSCNEIENTEHILYKCTQVMHVWQFVSECLKINVKWKNIVCGYLSSESSRNVVFINSFVSVISYSIVIFNNKEKCTNVNLSNSLLEICYSLNCY